MKLLIDTTSEYLCLLLSANHQIVAQQKKLVHFQHVEQTPNLINDFLIKHGLTWSKINSLYLVNGPGYYGGLRVGVMIVKAWALIYPTIKIYTISSLQFLLGNDRQGISYVAISKNNFFYQTFENNKSVTSSQMITRTQLRQQLTAQKAGNIKTYPTINIARCWEGQKVNFQKVTDIHRLTPKYLTNFC